NDASHFIGKEIERRSQEGEDLSVLENSGPIKYHARQCKTRPADAGTIVRARRFGLRQLMRESGRSQHPVQRFLDGSPVHPATRLCLEQAVYSPGAASKAGEQIESVNVIGYSSPTIVYITNHFLLGFQDRGVVQ